jgi:DNA-binding XRE family transcriptional regulator
MTGDELRRWREERGLLAKEVAKCIGVSPVTISRAEKYGPSRLIETLVLALVNPKGQLVARARHAITTRPKRGRPKKLGRPRKHAKGWRGRERPGRPRRRGRPRKKAKKSKRSV